MSSTQAAQRYSRVVRDLAVLDRELKIEKEKARAQTPWVKTPKANLFFCMVIVANGAFIGVQIEMAEGFHWGMWITESMFLLLFWIEIIMRMVAELPNIRRFFDFWGIFDLLVTLLGCLDSWIITPILVSQQEAENPLSSLTVLRMLRLFRLVALVRVFRRFSELLVLVKTIQSSLKAVAWMSLLLVMILYTGSVFTVLLIGVPYRETDPEVDKYFGSLSSALFSHFRAVTLESWPQVAIVAMSKSKWWSVYWGFVIVLGNGALVNVMVGITVEQVIRHSEEQEYRLTNFASASKQFFKTMRTFLGCTNLGSHGCIGRGELRELLADPRAREIMMAFGINLNIPATMLHTIMDLQGDGETTFTEFFKACMRLNGSAENIHSVFVQHDVCACHAAISEHMDQLEKELGALAAAEASKPAKVERAPECDSFDPEAELQRLSERLERFAEKQQRVQVEMRVLKEHVGLRTHTLCFSNTTSGLSACPASLDGEEGDAFAAAVSSVQARQLFLHQLGRGLGERCMDSVFGSPKRHVLDTADYERSNTTQSGSLRTAKRRELEQEFAEKKAAEARTHL